MAEATNGWLNGGKHFCNSTSGNPGSGEEA